MATANMESHQVPGMFPLKSPRKIGWKQDVVYLFQFKRSTCIPSMSPFSLKLETWLRMANVPYEVPSIKPGSIAVKYETIAKRKLAFICMHAPSE